jgi:hypothetical protein
MLSNTRGVLIVRHVDDARLRSQRLGVKHVDAERGI